MASEHTYNAHLNLSFIIRHLSVETCTKRNCVRSFVLFGVCLPPGQDFGAILTTNRPLNMDYLRKKKQNKTQHKNENDQTKKNNNNNNHNNCEQVGESVFLLCIAESTLFVSSWMYFTRTVV